VEALGTAILSIEGLLFLAHSQRVVGEVHSDVVAVDWMLSPTPPELRPDVVALPRELLRPRPKPRVIVTELAARCHLASSASRSSRRS
jgi:hypothetical protein